jgi:hypothetical protein
MSEQLPLVAREHLSEEDHVNILKKMVAGKIAAQEDIIESLDLNEYNHITATYFLLAERRLHAQRQDLARKLRLKAVRREQAATAAAAAVAAAAMAASGGEASADQPDTSLASQDASAGAVGCVRVCYSNLN